MAAVLPRLEAMLAPGWRVTHRTPDLTLFVEAEVLQRLCTQLALHGRQGLAEGTITLALDPVTLGNRTWALLTLELAGTPAPWEGDFLGLAWLQDAVRGAYGILEIGHDGRGFLWPRIFLPCQSREADLASRILAGRTVWIVDRDLATRDALAALVRGAGGQVRTHAGLRPFLEQARRHALPDILVLERTGPLERFQTRLRRLAGAGIPAVLLLGDGRPWTQGDGSDRTGRPTRVILLEKPFPGQNFLQCLLALSYERPAGPEPPESPKEPPCPPSP